MPRLSHSTLRSSPDERGYRHNLYIEPNTSTNCQHCVTYKARCFSHGPNRFHDPRNGQSVVAKFPHKGVDTKTWARKQMEIVKNAQDIAEKFNNFLKNATDLPLSENNFDEDDPDFERCRRGISFLQLQRAVLDATSFLEKKRKEGEAVLFEDKLKPFTHFTDDNGNLDSALLPKKSGSFKRRLSLRRPSTHESQSQSYCVQRSGSQRAREPASDDINDDVDNNGNAFQFVPSPPSYEESQREMLQRWLNGEINYSNQPMAIPSSNHNNNSTPDSSWSPNNNSSSSPDHGQSSSPWGSGSSLQSDSVDQSNNRRDFSRQSDFTDNRRDFSRQSDFTDNKRDCSRRRMSSTNRTRSTSVRSHDDSLYQGPHPMLQAFTHYFFCQTNGTSIVANFKGSNEGDDSYVLTTPTVHSLDQSYGDRDMGVVGIQKVIDNHVCTSLCRHLADMSLLLSEAQRARTCRELPSAPPLDLL